MHDSINQLEIKRDKWVLCMKDGALCTSLRKNTYKPKSLSVKVGVCVCVCVCVLCGGGGSDLQETGVGVSVYSVTAH